MCFTAQTSVEPKLEQKQTLQKTAKIRKIGNLQKPTYGTMGPILLSRSQEESSKIKEDLRFPAETRVEPKLSQKVPNKKLLKFVTKK